MQEVCESESEVAQSCLTLCDPWIVAHQAPPSMGFSRQEYSSGLPFPSPGYLPDSGIEPRSPTFQADAFNLCTTREALATTNDFTVSTFFLPSPVYHVVGIIQYFSFSDLSC